jgi:hypothetical protein
VSKRIADHQHYRNPLKGGWYYVDNGIEAASGLMTKRLARRYVKQKFGGRYGYNVMRHPDCPKNFLAKIFTRPKNSG